MHVVGDRPRQQRHRRWYFSRYGRFLSGILTAVTITFVFVIYWGPFEVATRRVWEEPVTPETLLDPQLVEVYPLGLDLTVTAIEAYPRFVWQAIGYPPMAALLIGTAVLACLLEFLDHYDLVRAVKRW